jgi:hypothetical protein
MKRVLCNMVSSSDLIAGYAGNMGYGRRRTRLQIWHHSTPERIDACDVLARQLETNILEYGNSLMGAVFLYLMPTGVAITGGPLGAAIRKFAGD